MPNEYVPVAIMKSYFSRRTQLVKQWKIVDDSVEENEEDTESDEEKEEGSGPESEPVKDKRIEKERSHISTAISVAISGINVVQNEWIAVAYDRDWYPGQFVKSDKEQEEMQAHFVHRSFSNRSTGQDILLFTLNDNMLHSFLWQAYYNFNPCISQRGVEKCSL